MLMPRGARVLDLQRAHQIADPAAALAAQRGSAPVPILDGSVIRLDFTDCSLMRLELRCDLLEQDHRVLGWTLWDDRQASKQVRSGQTDPLGGNAQRLTCGSIGFHQAVRRVENEDRIPGLLDQLAIRDRREIE